MKNYKIIKEEYLSDINSKGTILEHLKSGAKVVLLANDDENKTFAVAFRTPPKNSTGVPHIMEHSVLCGSRKFPVKEPFVELMKGSLNTFLNAMTFSDKTMYPVSSCNDKDFKNLVDVYMDAVFYPNIYQKEAIFKQEGWHYELTNKEDPIILNGVVYNEMKGAFSSPDEILVRNTMNALFPDNTYGVESGGDPENIPDLSYEEFKAFHQQYYHPSNSYIIIYGNCDMDAELQFLDEEYLSHFERINIDSSILPQAPFKEIKKVRVEYPVTKEQGTTNKALLCYATCLPENLSMEEQFALDIINAALVSSAGAPIERAILDAKLGSSVEGEYATEILQTVFGISVKDADEANLDKFRNIIDQVLAEQVKNGIDKKALEAALNRFEFKTREADFGGMSKGLIYAMTLMGTWLYDKDPFAFARFNSVFASLREKLNTNYFEQLIEKYLINNNHKALVACAPSLTIAEVKEAKLAKRLADFKATLSEEELEQLIQDTKELKEYQASTDSQVDLDKIPTLKKSDLSYDVLGVSNNIEVIDGVKVLHHDYNTNGISYLRLLFNAKDLPCHLIPYLGIYEALFKNLDTTKHTYQTLEQDINIHTGGIGASFSPKYLKEGYAFDFVINASAVTGKLSKAIEFIHEIIHETKYDMKKRILELLQTENMKMQQSLIGRGNRHVMNRSLSYTEEVYYLRDILSGIGYFENLTDLLKNFDDEYDGLVSAMQEITKYLFVKDNLMVSLTGLSENYQELKEDISALINSLGEKPVNNEPFKFVVEQKNEAFYAPIDINFVAISGNYFEDKLAYNGSYLVFQNALMTEYLWKRVRVLGGAYGVSCGFIRNGLGYFTSYRDPNIENTIKEYKNSIDFLKEFKPNEDEMLKYIIGVVGSIDAPLSPSLKGARSLDLYQSGRAFSELVAEKKKILDTTLSDLEEFIKVVESTCKYGNLCAIGNEQKIKENSNLFKTIKPLFR